MNGDIFVYLMSGVQESLAGRTALLQMLPLSQREIVGGVTVPFIYYYRDRDAKEIDLIIEGDGELCPLEIKKTAMPDKRLTNVFTVINKSPLRRGTGAVLCMAEKFGAFDRDNLIAPIWMITEVTQPTKKGVPKT